MFATLVLAACRFDKITIPPTQASVVVHAVMNPSTLTQIVLVERTLSGVETVRDSVFNPGDPIASDGGIPVHGAIVEISDSAGAIVRGVEDAGPVAGRGTGVYRLTFRTPIRPGGLYRLRVLTPQGEEVTGETRVPGGASPTPIGSVSRTLNRDHDTLAIGWPTVANARAYAVRVESPYGPYFLFSNSTTVRFPGDARNLFANNFEHLFIPGFRQDVSIGAVDSNFYDYYRTNNDPFTGTGIINRLDGGIGLFGSLLPVSSGTLNVVADQTEPIEGRYRLSGRPFNEDVPVTLTLYLESKSSRADVPDALSGRFTTAISSNPKGVLGEQAGVNIALVLVANQLAHDTIDVFVGELAADGRTLSGSFQRTTEAGRVTYIKQ